MKTTDERGVNNIFAKEPPMSYSEPRFGWTEYAEKLNGKIAMISLSLALISYATTGTIAFGYF